MDVYAPALPPAARELFLTAPFFIVRPLCADRTDYAQGGYKMVPLHDPTGEKTANLCLEYSLYLAAVPPLCYAAGLTSVMCVASMHAKHTPALAPHRFI